MRSVQWHSVLVPGLTCACLRPRDVRLCQGDTFGATFASALETTQADAGVGSGDSLAASGAVVAAARAPVFVESEPTGGGGSSGSNTLLIVGAAVAGAALVLTLCGVAYCWSTGLCCWARDASARAKAPAQPPRHQHGAGRVPVAVARAGHTAPPGQELPLPTYSNPMRDSRRHGGGGHASAYGQAGGVRPTAPPAPQVYGKDGKY